MTTLTDQIAKLGEALEDARSFMNSTTWEDGDPVYADDPIGKLKAPTDEALSLLPGIV